MIEAPVPAAVPPQEPVNHCSVAPVPADPPTAVSVVLPPVQIKVVPDMLVGAVEDVWNVMTTSSVEAVHGAFEIVQRKVEVVPAVPVNADVGLVGVVMLPPAPETIVHKPVPKTGLFAAKVVEVPQMFWSGPAFAVVGAGVKMMITSSTLEGHGAFAIVQRRV